MVYSILESVQILIFHDQGRDKFYVPIDKHKDKRILQICVSLVKRKAITLAKRRFHHASHVGKLSLRLWAQLGLEERVGSGRAARGTRIGEFM